MGHDKSEVGPFDLERLKQLVELMEKHDLRMVKLQKGEERWQLQRGAQEVMTAVPATGFAPAPMAAPQSAGPAAAPAATAAPALPAGTPIKSPTVGTYYSAPQPGDPPFVKVGDRVSPDKTVCILEAMKVFNSIPAGISGTISKILASDGDAIDFGQPLFLVTQD